MARLAALIAALVGLGGCSGTLSVIEDEEIIASTRYDGVPCAELASQRDAIAATYGLAPDVRRTPVAERTPGVGLLSPDPLSRAERQRRQAIAMVDAMNRSMERRRCEAA